MPLLGKEPFVRHELPENISPEEQVFVCKATNEAFLTYDHFFERQILCSSMVWTCSVTNKTGLTYEEAVQSERNANEMLNAFPIGLQIPIIYLMNYINESKIGSIVDIIYSFIYNRFFIGEDIELIINTKSKLNGKVFRVIPPSNKQNQREDGLNIDPKWFEYEIIDKNRDRHIVNSERIIRTKGVLSKDKIRLFLKQHLTSAKRLQPMTVKDSSQRRFSLFNIKWNQIFAGPEPVFKGQTPIESKPSTSSDTNQKITKKSENIVKNNSSIDSKNLNNSSKIEDKQNIKGNEKLDKLSQKEKEREQKKEWSIKRDDLACDDLRPLPSPVPIKNRIPVELFADTVFVMEFLHNFKDLIDMKAIFPLGISYELMEQILFDVDIDGPFPDLIKILLTTNFALLEDDENSAQNNERDSSDDEDRHSPEEEKIDRNSDQLNVKISNDKNPYHYYHWIQIHLGFKLSQISLDSFTITEVLRLYLLCSGGGPEPKSKYRGLYHSREDPSIEFVAENRDILTKLEFDSVFNLKPEERVKIFNVLIHQLLSYYEFRYKIDDSFDEMTKFRKKIRDIQMEFNKWVKDNKPLNKKDSQNESQKSNASNATTVSMTEELNEFNREKSVKEEEKYKNLDEIRSQMFKLQSSYGLKPIGRDRAFRKYWVFESLPGLFVEYIKPDTKYTTTPFGPCLPVPTPTKSLDSNCFEEIDNKTDCSQRDDSSTTSDKENELNSVSDNNINDNNNLHKSYTFNLLSHLDKCTADITTCAVHGLTNAERTPEWAFYYTCDHLNSLIESLNVRGFRESELIFSLKREKNIIVENMNKCQPYKLNTDIPAPESRRSQRLVEVFHSRKRKQSSSRLTFSERFVEILKEDLIILEEKLFAASLAVETDLSRNEWRKSFEGNSHNKQELIRVLSKAILTLKESIRSMCLSLPLSDENIFQNWSQSLSESKSLSQLFVHLSILDDSIKWSKSAREAYCKICRRKYDAQNMLLCDQCNRGHHTYCLQPSLDAIPRGEWFCPDCCPKFKPQTPKKDERFSKLNYESDYNTTDDEDINYSESNSESETQSSLRKQKSRLNTTPPEDICKLCSKFNTEISCAECHGFYHLSCVNVKRMTRSDWFCSKCLINRSKDEKKRKIFIDFSDDSLSDESNTSYKPSKRSRYSQDFDYNNGKSIEDEEEEEINTNTSARRRLDRNIWSLRTSFHLDFSLCDNILKKLQRHSDGWLFMSRPNQAPNYNKVIKKYMDFGQLVSKLNTGDYTSNLDFFRDILLMLNNASFYNQINTDEYTSCQSLAQYFQTLLEEYNVDLKNISILKYE